MSLQKLETPWWMLPSLVVVAGIALVMGAIGSLAGSQIAGALDGRRAEAPGGLAEVGVRTQGPLPSPAPGTEGSIAAVAQELLPSTVQVLVMESKGDRQATGTGSGFVLDGRGHVVTNNHVVQAAVGSGRIEVVDSAGRGYRATIVGRSPVYDVAVLKVDRGRNLRPAALGSSRELRVGDPLVAFGAPLGLNQTVTSGIVSALDRPVTTGNGNQDTSFINAVQTDAAINPGNSGGPLVNLSGQVVGVNTAIATAGGLGGESGNIGVGFAIGIDQVRTTVDQILKTGEARYPLIGASVSTFGTGIDGAEISAVEAGSPAAKAGLAVNDVVVAIEGVRVTDGIAMIVSIRTHQPRDTIELTVRRGDQDSVVEVTLDGKVG